MNPNKHAGPPPHHEWTKELGDAFWRGVRHQAERSGSEKPTLRDLFAMAALVGISVDGEIVDAEKCGTYCYRLADGLLAARKGGSDE